MTPTAVINSNAVQVQKKRILSFMHNLGNTGFLPFFKIKSIFFRYSKKKSLRTILILAIAIVCGIAILSAFFVLGSIYQQELYQEYLEEKQDSENSRDSKNPNLPSIDILP